MPEDVLTLDDLAPADKRQITGLKRSVSSLAEKFGVVRESARDLAPKVMKLFNQLQAKHENLGGFIGFARLFDATIPNHAADRDGEEGYRKHRTYYALDYMRRLVNVRPRGGQQGRRDPARDWQARTIATILQIVRDPDPVWKAVAQEFGLRERGLARLKSRVEGAKPIINLTAVMKPVKVDDSKIVHMEPAARQANVGEMQETLEGIQREGRRVKVAARGRRAAA